MSENPIAIRSKNNIEAALIALMKEKPYSDITISAIARRAGLSRQAFYLNFDNKEAVLLRSLKRLFDDIMQLVRYKKIDSVDALVATYTDVVENNAVYFKSLADNNLTGLVCRLFSYELVQLPPVLPSQRENQTTAERRYFNAFWVSAFVEVYALWLTEGMATDRSEINRIITDIMLGNYFRKNGNLK